MRRVEISLSQNVKAQIDVLRNEKNLWICIIYTENLFTSYTRQDLILILSELDIYRLEIDLFLINFDDILQAYVNCSTNIREIHLKDQIKDGALIAALLFLSLEDFKGLSMTRTKPIEVFRFNHYTNLKGRIQDNSLLIELAVKVLERDTTLRILELPKCIKYDVRILDALDHNYSLLEPGDEVDHWVFQRNRDLLQLTRKLVIVFLVRRQSYKYLSKDIILLIAKSIWRLRHDKEHLRILAYELEK